ncbi:MAG: porin [bacterium]
MVGLLYLFRMMQKHIGILICLLSAPSVAYADDPEIDTVEVVADDKSASFSVGLDAQFRAELNDSDGSSPRTQFAFRRLRPILGFKAFEDFSAKVVAEFAGPPELEDGIVGWSPSPNFSLEAGQFAPPFNWERDGSSDYHQFTERSVANREFQIANGRDIGLQVDFELDRLLDVEVGIFNGAGSNSEVEPGRGHIIAGRVAYAPLGAYHEVEVVPFVVDRLVLMVALGGFLARNNAWRDWTPPDMSSANQSADVWSITADAHIWFWRFSAAGTLPPPSIPIAALARRQIGGRKFEDSAFGLV